MRFSNLVLSSTFSVRTLRFVTILPALCRLVGTDDVLHQLVADDILFIETDGGDIVNTAQHADNVRKAGAFALRQVDLGDIAGDDDLGIETQTG